MRFIHFVFQFHILKRAFGANRIASESSRGIKRRLFATFKRENVNRLPMRAFSSDCIVNNVKGRSKTHTSHAKCEVFKFDIDKAGNKNMSRVKLLRQASKMRVGA